MLAIVGVAYAVAGLLFWHAERLAPGVLPLALGGGTTLITAVAYFSAENPSPLIFLYLWVFLYSAYFFTTSDDDRADRLRGATACAIAADGAFARRAASPRGGWSSWARWRSRRS